MKLSIITINFNNKEGLQRTIDSVIDQTWRDFEWIIIDGGSTDGSKELIEQYQQHFAYWCSEPDKGVYNAMNKGIKHAQGEYLLFLNSGDALYDKHVLQKVDDLNIDTDIISGQVERMDNHQLLRVYDENLLLQLCRDTLSHQGTFIKRELFSNYSYREDFLIVSDWIAWLEWLIKQDCSIIYIDDIIALQDMTGLSNTNADVQQKERKEGMSLVLGKRLSEELISLINNNEYLKGELGIHAIKMLREMYYNTPKCFSLLYRVIIVVDKIRKLFRIYH